MEVNRLAIKWRRHRSHSSSASNFRWCKKDHVLSPLSWKKNRSRISLSIGRIRSVIRKEWGEKDGEREAGRIKMSGHEGTFLTVQRANERICGKIGWTRVEYMVYTGMRCHCFIKNSEPQREGERLPMKCLIFLPTFFFLKVHCVATSLFLRVSFNTATSFPRLYVNFPMYFRNNFTALPFDRIFRSF